MSDYDTDLIPYINDLLTNSEAYYDEVLDDGITSEEFEEFFVAKLEEQGRHWKIEKVRNMIEMEEEENDTK